MMLLHGWGHIKALILPVQMRYGNPVCYEKLLADQNVELSCMRLAQLKNMLKNIYLCEKLKEIIRR